MLGPRATLVGVPSIIETNGLTPTFDKKVVEGDKRTVGFTTADLLPDTDYRFKITVGDTDGQQHSAICILSSRQ
jgi:hypothetical protein